MYLRILRKDLKRRKTMNIILLIFITLAAMFIASGANNMATVMTALDRYFEKAEVADYYIAVSDETARERFCSFAGENGYFYKDMRMIQIDPKNVQVNGMTLDYASTTNISTLQGSKVFDSNSKELTRINDGEIYVTSNIFYSGKNDFYAGAKLTVEKDGKKKEFTVKDCVKDVLFGSGMTGMTRFLVSENDYAFFNDEDTVVITVSGVYTDEDETVYMEKFNEIELNTIFAINYAGAKMMYIMDILTAAVVLVVSICLVLISMVMLHFTIHFTISEEFREIGVMKAIGIPNAGIRGLLIVKYFAVSMAGAVIGFILSIPFGNMLIKNVSQNIIISSDGKMALNAVCAAGTAAVVMIFCYLCTRKIKKFTPIDAIRNGENGERYAKKGVVHLCRCGLPVIPFMALNDISSGIRKYASMIAIFTLGLLLVLIPVNTINTLQSDKLIRWFNMTDCDFVIAKEALFTPDGNNREMIEEQLEEIREMFHDNGIETETFQEVMFRMNIICRGKKMSSLAVQGIGDVTTEQYFYIEGSAPQSRDEVAISYMVADNIGAGIGDDVQINIGNETRTYTVTAINQSMSNMGECIRFYQEETLDYAYAAGCFAIQVAFTDDPDTAALNERRELLQKAYPDEQIYTAGEYIDNQIGGIAGQLEQVKSLILAVVLCINMLVSVLMVKSFITKEKSEIAILKAVGFRNGSLVLWQTLRIGFTLLISVIAGTLLSAPLSKLIIEPIFRMMGAYSIEFEIRALEVYVYYPLVVLAVTSFSAYLSAQGLRGIAASEASNIE